MEIEAELAIIESLVSQVSGPPTRRESDRLKASTGYKRLLAAADRQFKGRKAALIPNCRRTWRGPHAEWLAAAVVLDEYGVPEWPSLLGTGGNDGNLDFTNNFMQRIGELFDVSANGQPLPGNAELLANSLWSEPANRLAATGVGQFQPGSAGGANSSTGVSGDSLVNPWDFVLMMEGSLLFSARATRRLDPSEFSRARRRLPYDRTQPDSPPPARKKPSEVSNGCRSGPNQQRWPTWPRCSARARIQLDRQTAARPVDVARAISRLGVARGIEAFTRYGYLERNGQSTLAVPLGRIHVCQNPHAYLIDDLALVRPSATSPAETRTPCAAAPSRKVPCRRRICRIDTRSVPRPLAGDFAGRRLGRVASSVWHRL